MQDLQGHVPAQHGILSPIDLAHATGGDAGDDLVPAVDGGFQH
jgi:hypothetical protein